MKKTLQIILTILILIIISLLVYNNISKTNELKQKNQDIENLTRIIEENKQNNQSLVLQEIDGQIFIMKSNGITYCNLGKDSNGNVIETIANKDECVLTTEICSILKTDGIKLNKENPNYLSKCK